ncbi:MAG: molecular chaperone DnaK [Erysipelotrichales bacterium]|nr:molecular chaperone DnaK [Erysipelotrichales bacterium]
MGKVIGIDLGTTNSCVAFYENGKAKIIENKEGQKTTPSIVAFDKNGKRLVGEVAKRQFAMNPERTIKSIKREMGNAYHKKIDGKDLTPQILSSMILQKLKLDAQEYLKEDVTKAVITVPAYFSDAQRQATKDAGRIAGLEILRIINEPTAAALAYGLENDYGQKVMVFDLGGGTFDVSIIEIGNGVIEVLSTSGDNHLGGDDFNKAVCDYIIQTFKQQEGIDLSRDLVAYSRIEEASEKAKIELSTMQSTKVLLPFITTVNGTPKNLEMTLTKQKYDELTKHLVDRIVGPMQTAMNDARLTPSELNKIILVGGSSRMPSVQSKIKDITGIEPNKSLNPDECVALGAAIQGGKLSGEMVLYDNNDILLLDVTPLTLSIETVGGVATPLIERNTTIPTSHSQVFTTSSNFQTQVEINVLQGERPLAKDNQSLGKFKLKKIKRAMRGVPQIEVTFDIDSNGIVNVSAKDLASGNSQSITIEGSSNMSDADIEEAIRQAKQFETEDNMTKERLLFKNEVETLLIQVENGLAVHKKEMDKTLRKQIKDELSSFKKLTKKLDYEHCSEGEYQMVKEAKSRLETIAQSILGG